MKFLISLICLSVLVASVISAPADSAVKTPGENLDAANNWLNDVRATAEDSLTQNTNALVDGANAALKPAVDTASGALGDLQNTIVEQGNAVLDAANQAGDDFNTLLNNAVAGLNGVSLTSKVDNKGLSIDLLRS